MNILKVGIFFLLVIPASPLFAGNYIITINGKSIEMNLDRETKVVLPDGTSVELCPRKCRSFFAWIKPDDLCYFLASVGEIMRIVFRQRSCHHLSVIIFRPTIR